MSMLKSGRPSKKDKAINAVQETNDGMVRMNINIPKLLHKEIKKFALERDVTVTDLVKKALNDYMSK